MTTSRGFNFLLIIGNLTRFQNYAYMVLLTTSSWIMTYECYVLEDI
jgi:hypothetical protein